MSVWIHESPKNRSTYHSRKCGVCKRIDAIEVSQQKVNQMNLPECKICSGDRKEQDHNYGYQEYLRNTNASGAQCERCGKHLMRENESYCEQCANLIRQRKAADD